MLERILAETSEGMPMEMPIAAAVDSLHHPSAKKPRTNGVRRKAATGGWSVRWAETRMKLGGMFSLEQCGDDAAARLAMTAAMAFFSHRAAASAEPDGRARLRPARQRLYARAASGRTWLTLGRPRHGGPEDMPRGVSDGVAHG